ncbi:MAG TPA: hypothetical protein VKB51_13305 [bacterium]|nr:hypothetical protein [bacterium]
MGARLVAPAGLRRLLLAGVVTALLAGGCSSTPLLTKAQYEPSRAALAQGAPEQALAKFPAGEPGTFITTMERTYLSLLEGRPDIDALARYSERIEDRVRYDVSREVKSFFYVATPEGYYASEHEVIWMHMLLSWGYSLRGQYEDGCVEAREASRLLSARWSPEGHFDDPSMRSILGELWALCGDWDDAQVDFRRAWELDPTLGWALELGQRAEPPRALFLVLGGIGPTPEWDPKAEFNPLRGVRNIHFRSQALGSAATIYTWQGSVPLHRTPDAAPWYVRHQARDNAIHDLIGDSQYGIDSTMRVGVYAGSTSAGVLYGAGIVTLSIAGGGLVVYLAAEAGSGEGVAYGILIAAAGSAYGIKQSLRIEREARARLVEKSDPSPYYRFVRFLPDYAWIGWSDEPAGRAVWVETTPGSGHDEGELVPALETVAPNVYIGYLPDVALP